METNLLPKTTQITENPGSTVAVRFSDNELYRMARIYGKRAIFWRRKFMGLLPEISKRKIYEKKGFSWDIGKNGLLEIFQEIINHLFPAFFRNSTVY
ncbi:MAG: hypothetical protein WC897_04280 [Candidatus Gracilibacteria bacterium]